MSQYLSEAFKRLNFLNEDTFSVTGNGLEEYKDFMDNDEFDDTIDIIDMEAETEEELQDSYVGKVILDCCVCHSKLYKDVEDVVVDGDLANVNEECPFCYTVDGFKVIGQVAEFGQADEDEKDDDKDIEDTDDVELDESLLTEGKLIDNVKKVATRVGADAATLARCFTELGEIIKNIGKDGDDYKTSKVNDWMEHIENKAALKALMSGNEKVMNGFTKEDIEELTKDVQDYIDEKKAEKSKKDNVNECLFSKKSDKASTLDVWVQMDGKKWVTDKNIPSDKVEPYVKDSEKAFQGNKGFKVWTEPHNPKAWAKCFDLKGNVIKNPIPEGLFGKKKDKIVYVVTTKDGKQIPYDSFDKAQSAAQDGEYAGKAKSMATMYQKPDGSFESIPEDSDDYEGIKSFYESKSIKEAVNNINVETDTDVINVTPDENGKVTVSTEPKDTTATDGEETIQPLEPEVQDEIDSNVSDGEEIEIDVDEFDEESFDELGEGYLKKVYENVNSFKTSNVSFIKDKLIVEGVINFTSGKSKKTNFIFGIREATRSGKIRFIGENKEIARGRKSFTVTGKLEGNKFLSESLNYNYGVKNAQGKAQRLYGTIKNIKRG